MIPTSALISKKLDTKKQISLAIKKYSLQSKSLLAIKISSGASKSFGRWARSLVLGNNCLQLVNVGSSEVSNLCLVLQEDKGWHCSHLKLLCNVFAVINVDLEEDHVVHGL